MLILKGQNKSYNPEELVGSRHQWAFPSCLFYAPSMLIHPPLSSLPPSEVALPLLPPQQEPKHNTWSFPRFITGLCG